MRRAITYILMLTGVFYSVNLEAREYQGPKNLNPNTNKDLAADCAPS